MMGGIATVYDAKKQKHGNVTLELKMKNKLYLEDIGPLLKQGCGDPNCTHQHESELCLKQRCHPDSGVAACIEAGKDTVQIRCFECGMLIVEIAVASKEPEVDVIVE